MTTTKKAPVVDEVDEPDDVTSEETPTKDLESLIPVSSRIKLSTDDWVNVRPLRTRETLKLLKILTTGGSAMISNVDWTMDDPDVFAGQLLSLALFAIPSAEDETIAFLQFMVEPDGLIDPPRSKGDKARNEELWEALIPALGNPDLEDTIHIVSTIIQIEAPNIARLGKALRSMLPAGLLS